MLNCGGYYERSRAGGRDGERERGFASHAGAELRLLLRALTNWRTPASAIDATASGGEAANQGDAADNAGACAKLLLLFQALTSWRTPPSAIDETARFSAGIT